MGGAYDRGREVEIYGQTGNDTILARDGWSERISCGDGYDTVEADSQDYVFDCESVTLG
jgi:hypothetical protein